MNRRQFFAAAAALPAVVKDLHNPRTVGLVEPPLYGFEAIVSANRLEDEGDAALMQVWLNRVGGMAGIAAGMKVLHDDLVAELIHGETKVLG